MNAEAELFRAYREWRRLALAASKAIQTRNWNLFSDCHRAIQDYQSAAPGLTRAARAEWQRGGCDVRDKESNLRVTVAELMDITRRNHTQLRQMLDQARQRREELSAASRNLHMIRRTYGQIAGTPAS
jgi:hypothetical protein